MRKLIISGSMAVLAMSIASHANAADLLNVPTSGNQDLPIADQATNQFDWTGFYAGVYGLGQWQNSNVDYGLGLVLGYNVQSGFYLLGAEAGIAGLTDGSGSSAYGQVLGRGGIVVTDQTLLYGALGYGTDFGSPVNDHALVGAGLEYAVSDNMSVRAQYLYGFPVSGNDPMQQVTLGANFHF
ncbi:MAG TPA: porin family protein [Devosiaceae bacterium]